MPVQPKAYCAMFNLLESISAKILYGTGDNAVACFHSVSQTVCSTCGACHVGLVHC